MLGGLRKRFGKGGSGNLSDPQSSETERSKVGLYECSRCETTYVGADMNSCPNCGHQVEPLATGHELGMLNQFP